MEMLYFGVLKECFGAERDTVELPAESTVEDLLQVLRGRVEETAVWTSMAVAVNREYAGRAMLLHEGDEVALLPPVSGGCRRLQGVRYKTRNRFSEGAEVWVAR